MKFKDWLNNESTVGTAVLHGGIGEAPNQNLNVNMPVRSRFSTSDGQTRQKDDVTMKKPEFTFGFSSKDRKNKERKSMTIDRKDRFPIDTRNVASIGFSG